MSADSAAPRQSGRNRQPTARAIESALQNAAPQRGERRRRADSGSEADSGSDTEPSTPAAAPAAPLTRAESFAVRYKTAERTNEEVLDNQVAKWTSAAYTHFKMPPTIEEKSDGTVVYYFYCLRKPSEFISRSRHDESTSNLVRHCSRCAPATNTAEATALSRYVTGSSYSKARHRVDCCLWVCRRRRPYAIVEDPELLNMFSNLHAPVETPSASTLARDVKEIFSWTRDNVVEVLVKVDGKIHLTADGWTSPNTISYLGVTVQYVENSSIITYPLDFIKLTKAHTGQYLAMRLAQCIQEFRIGDKLLGFTGDNGSNNDTMVEELAILIPSFPGLSHRVRCIAHILNLVAKAILSAFCQKVTDDAETAALLVELDEDGDIPAHDDDEDDTEDGDEVAPEVEASDNQTVGDIAAEADLDGRLASLSERDAAVARVAISKLKRLARTIANSPTMIEALYECCDRAKVPRQRIKKDVSTRWNSTSELARSGLHLRPALDRMVLLPEFNKPGGARLRRCHVTEAEWTILGQLDPLLNVISYATKKVSQSATPLVHSVIPLIDTLTGYFDKTIDDPSLHPTVRHAALRGVLMLNKYYARSDESVVYRIAMVLHPEFKLDYFKKARWPVEWISEARRVATEEWTTRYKATTPSSAAARAPVRSSSPRVDRYADVRDIFDTHLQPVDTDTDALEEWLNTPVIPLHGKLDVLQYWDREKANGNPLAQMALNYLSMPAASTDVERAFSRGGLTVSKLRHSLSDSSTRAASVLGAWHGVPGLVPYDMLVSKFAEKNKRPKKKARVEAQAADVIDLESS